MGATPSTPNAQLPEPPGPRRPSRSRMRVANDESETWVHMDTIVSPDVLAFVSQYMGSTLDLLSFMNCCQYVRNEVFLHPENGNYCCPKLLFSLSRQFVLENLVRSPKSDEEMRVLLERPLVFVHGLSIWWLMTCPSIRERSAICSRFLRFLSRTFPNIRNLSGLFPTYMPRHDKNIYLPPGGRRKFGLVEFFDLLGAEKELCSEVEEFLLGYVQESEETEEGQGLSTEDFILKELRVQDRFPSLQRLDNVKGKGYWRELKAVGVTGSTPSLWDVDPSNVVKEQADHWDFSGLSPEDFEPQLQLVSSNVNVSRMRIRMDEMSYSMVASICRTFRSLRRLFVRCSGASFGDLPSLEEFGGPHDALRKLGWDMKIFTDRATPHSLLDLCTRLCPKLSSLRVDCEGSEKARRAIRISGRRKRRKKRGKRQCAPRFKEEESSALTGFDLRSFEPVGIGMQNLTELKVSAVMFTDSSPVSMVCLLVSWLPSLTSLTVWLMKTGSYDSYDEDQLDAVLSDPPRTQLRHLLVKPGNWSSTHVSPFSLDDSLQLLSLFPTLGEYRTWVNPEIPVNDARFDSFVEGAPHPNLSTFFITTGNKQWSLRWSLFVSLINQLPNLDSFQASNLEIVDFRDQDDASSESCISIEPLEQMRDLSLHHCQFPGAITSLVDSSPNLYSLSPRVPNPMFLHTIRRHSSLRIVSVDSDSPSGDSRDFTLDLRRVLNSLPMVQSFVVRGKNVKFVWTDQESGSQLSDMQNLTVVHCPALDLAVFTHLARRSPVLRDFRTLVLDFDRNLVFPPSESLQILHVKADDATEDATAGVAMVKNLLQACPLLTEVRGLSSSHRSEIEKQLVADVTDRSVVVSIEIKAS